MMNMKLTVRMALFPKMLPRMADCAPLSAGARIGCPLKGTTSNRNKAPMETTSGEIFSHMNIATVRRTSAQTNS